MTETRFGVLGPVEVWRDSEPIPIGGPQRRGLLAVLLLHANRVVSVDRLVDDLWEEPPPATARGLLQGIVAGLRRSLREPGGGGRLETAAPGYRLRVGPGELDLDRFEELAADAGRTRASDPVRAGDRYAQALSLWRGPALDGIDLAGCRAEVARLAERRLTVLAERIDTDLWRGRHADLVGELYTHVESYPLRERLWAQLMLALHAADRRADALDAYQRLRRTLVDELGVEPGATVQQLQRAILAGDDPLAGYLNERGLPPPRPAAPQLPLTEPAAPVRPAELPLPPAGFAGRRRQLARLDELVTDSDRGPRIGLITGMAGVGKTALAVHWAHRIRHRFGHGQLYVNLRGFAPSPMRPITALAGALQALGVPAGRIPLDLDQAAGQYRSLLADRRMLVVLDNAHSIEQVRPLLPGGDGCLVLVTSRELLGGLVAREGAANVDLDVLDPGEAEELLGNLLGEQRTRAEPAATAELARLCAYLPLALRVAAANLAVHSPLRVADQVARLAAGDRLAALAIPHDEQAAVRTAFDQSYAALPADARRLFRLLSLQPGPHLTVAAAAALAGTTPAVATRLLDRLTGGHLLDQPSPGQYTLHDLLRLYAAERVQQEDTVDDSRAAAGRLYDWYVHTTAAAARLLYPDTLRLDPAGTGPEPAHPFNGRATTLDWLEAERPNLLAVIQHTAEHGPHPVAYRLAHALAGFYILRAYASEWLAVTSAGLAAARLAPDPRAEAVMELSLGNAWLHQNAHARGTGHYRRALELSERTGWGEAACAVLNGLGNVARRTWRLAEAMDHYQRALAINRRSGWHAGQAANLGNLGLIHLQLGDLRRATDCVSESLALCHDIGAHGKEAQGWALLGEVHQLRGDLDDAERCLTTALAMSKDAGDQTNQADYLRALAGVCADAGDLQRALALAEAALASARELSVPRYKTDALNTLGTVHYGLGSYRRARECHEDALRVARLTENRWAEVVALIGLAASRRQLDLTGDATAAALQAHALACQDGYRVQEGNALVALAAIDLVAGRLAEAVAHAERAVAVHRDTGHRLGEARAEQELGYALRARGRTGAGIASLRRAYALYTEIGSPEAEPVRASLPPDSSG